MPTKKGAYLCFFLLLNYSICTYQQAHAMDLHPTPYSMSQDAQAYWWSPTVPSDESFELPSGVKMCSLLRVRFIGEVAVAVSRFLPTFPVYANISIEDNFQDQTFAPGGSQKVFMYDQYDGVPFASSKRNTQNAIVLADKDSSNRILNILPAELQPQAGSSFVCAFKNDGVVYLSYFLRRKLP